MRTFEIFCPEGFLIEIRALHITKKNDVHSGYFKSYEEAYNAIQQYDSDYNIYFIFNIINEMCYSMAQKDKMLYGVDTTADKDIIARNWVMIDLDPNRLGKKVSSTDEERERSKMKAHEVRNYLRDQGFSYPVVCSSGSGYHLMYRVDGWANTPENEKVVSNFLNALALLFTDKFVDVDIKVGNAARITKLYGTMARKGSPNDTIRPHRLSKIVLIPDEILSTDKSLFLKVNQVLPVEEPKTYNTNYGEAKFDINEFINKHNIQVASDDMVGGTRRIRLAECPFNSAHRAPDSAVFVTPSGGLSFSCFHSSCSQYTWKDFRLHYDPTAYDKNDYQEHRNKVGYYNPMPTPFVPKEESADKGKKWLSMSDIKNYDPTKVVSIPTGFPQLDRAIGGLAMGEVTLVSGTNGSGKSSWLNVLSLNAIQRNFKVAIWSGELPADKLKKWINQIAAGKNFVERNPSNENDYNPTNSTVSKIDKWDEGKLFLYNNNYGCKFEQILNDMKEIIASQGVTLLIVDNLMALDIDGQAGDKYNKQKLFILEICSMAKKLNVHIIMVAHPRKENGLLRKESISGTGDLSNAVDNVIICHRCGEDFTKKATEFFGKDKALRYSGYSNIVEVCKNRSFGVNDYLVGMYYEVESKRFKNYEAEYICYGWQDPPIQQPLITIPPIEYHPDHTHEPETRDDMPFGAPIDESPF